MPGPGLQPFPEPLAGPRRWCGPGRRGAARAGARERAEARPARRRPQRPLASAGRKQRYGNMAAPRCTPGGRRAEEPAGGGRRASARDRLPPPARPREPVRPGEARQRALRGAAHGDGSRRARRPRIKAWGKVDSRKSKRRLSYAAAGPAALYDGRSAIASGTEARRAAVTAEPGFRAPRGRARERRRRRRLRARALAIASRRGPEPRGKEPRCVAPVRAVGTRPG